MVVLYTMQNAYTIYQWWDNFLGAIPDENVVWIDWEEQVHANLALHGAKLVLDASHIEFQYETNMTEFLLKWG